MNIGEKVRGVPSNARLKVEHPLVVGTYDKTDINNGSLKFTVHYVQIADGTYVDCEEIMAATRRDQITESVE